MSIQLYNGDCLQVMNRMITEGEKVDLVVTSPPYDNLRTYNNSSIWNFDVFKKVADRLFKIVKDGGVVVWVVGDATIKGSETGTSFRQALYFKEIGFNLHDTMIYAKQNPTPNAGRRYQQCFEYMFIFSKGNPKTVNIILEPRHNLCNDKRMYRIKKTNRRKDGNFCEAKLYEVKENIPRQNIWTYKVGLYNSTSYKPAFEHPAIFPEQLANDHIISWSNENDIVFDPFMGSGTTGKMCKLLKRNFIGVEIDKQYFDIAKDRIECTTNGLFGLDGHK